MAVILVGMMGSGKSTVGRLAASLFGLKFIDLDEEIERTAGIKIAEIFKRYGEDEFRRLESEALKRVESSENMVLSVGGGAMIKPENVETMRKIGKIVYLQTSLEELERRLEPEKSNRPLLQEGSHKTLKDLLEKRRAVYETADIILVTERFTPEEMAEIIAGITQLP